MQNGKNNKQQTSVCCFFLRYSIKRHSYNITINDTNNKKRRADFDTIGSLVDEDLMWLLPYIDKYYVVDDTHKSQGSHCENYHCDHYLEISIKED